MTLLAAAVMLLGTAWMSDDAFITLRVVDNFINGYGLRYNVIDRVQVFTHPLWLMLITPIYALTREPMVTTMLVSASVSLAALWLLGARIAKDAGYGSLLILFAMASRAIYQFSSSGLECPLTFLLLGLLVWQLYRTKNVGTPAIIIGLLMLNRLDLAVLVGPAAAYLFFRERSKRTMVSLAIALPMLAWMVFSVIYFGTPLPNTAYAKLGTGYDIGEVVAQGLAYIRDFVLHDPLLALVIIKVVMDSARSRDGITRMLGGGIVLYVAYIITVGGDFMSARFFTAPGFLALCMLAGAPAPAWLSRHVKFACLTGVALIGLLLVMRIDQEQSSQQYNGITDERRVFYAYTGLLPALNRWAKTGFETVHPSHPWWQNGLDLKAQAQTTGSPIAIWTDTIGMRGYYAGPNVHIVDRVALADAFLARLPAVSGSRVGHYIRKFPKGYVETVLNSSPTTSIEALRPLLNDVTLTTRYPLFAQDRWSAIGRLNLGYYNWIRGADIYR